MNLLILPSARDDLRGGFYFYEKQRAGLGDYFAPPAILPPFFIIHFSLYILH